MRLRSLFLPLLLLLTLCACTYRPRTAVFTYRALPQDGWDIADTLLFPVDSLPADGRYVLHVLLRTDAATRQKSSVSLDVEQAWQLDSTCVQRQRRVRTALPPEPHAVPADIALHADTISLQQGARGHVVVRHATTPRILRGLTHIGMKLELAAES